MAAPDSLAKMMARPIAHRGLHGCGAPGPVENTIAAALAAVEAGYGIECDVRFARDGTPVVIHDTTLERLAGRAEAIADLTAAALTAIPLRGGGTVPTLEALLAAVDGRVALVVEIKPLEQPHLAEVVVAQVNRYGGAVVLESFDRAVLAHCGYAACPVGLVGPPEGSGGNTLGENGGDRTSAPRCDFLSWNVARLDTVPAALPLTAWTVRAAADAACAARAGAQIVFEGWRP